MFLVLETEYGRTPIKALLLMSSGIAFSEDYANTSSDIYTLARLTLEQDPGGSLAAVKRFNTRRAAPGALFSYSSAETLVLGLVLAAATKRTVSDYAAEKLWQPLGAEADATWIIDATGQEITFAYVNAVLRDWARLGLMLANRGNWFGKTVVPEDWLRASATNAIPTESPREIRISGLVFCRHQAILTSRPPRTIRSCRSGPEIGARADRPQ